MRSLLVRSRKQENVTLATMPVIRIGTKTICPFPICRLAEGWGSGYNESVMFCFLINLYRIGDINDIKTTKLYLKSRLYYGGLCTSHLYPPPPPTHTQTENGEDNSFSSITAWDLLKGIALLFIDETMMSFSKLSIALQFLEIAMLVRNKETLLLRS